MTSHFIWYELLTTDVDAATEFYAGVLDWKVAPSAQPDRDYRQISMQGVPVGGLMALPPGALESGMLPGFYGYIRVADVDAAAERIEAAGGSIQMPGTDISGIGRFAFVSDPQGVSFYVMTPIGEEGSATSFAPGRPGHGGWHELHTGDWKAAFDFYRGQFGWAEVNAMDMGPMGTYLQFNTGSGDAIGGMLNDADADHPHWLYYLNVDDIDAAHARVIAGGGQALMAPHQVPTGDWIFPALDPQRARFALVGPRKGS
jgi:predicted enzyme related to lactoylglutathione lyase